MIRYILLFICFALPALAFHDGGVGNCEACHIIHNSEDGLPPPGTPLQGAEMLLRYKSSTDLCLSCHADDNGAVWGDNPLAPPNEHGAGNFVFLQEDEILDGISSGTTGLDGSHAGHNVSSLMLGIGPDPVNTVSPGGNYLASNLRCTSCHDPHGNGNFRMLYSAGATTADGFTYTFNAPQADGISLNGGPETQTNHTAYKSGMSNWCRNCHGLFHQQSNQPFPHPVDRPISGDEGRTYNRYDGDDNPTGGSSATAYLPQVPFEDAAMATSWTGGPHPSSRISCISCHRAHATSGLDAGRWDFRVEFLSQDGVISGSWPIPNPYADVNQRSLCNKCHNRSSSDHGNGQACITCHRSDADELLLTPDVNTFSK